MPKIHFIIFFVLCFLLHNSISAQFNRNSSSIIDALANFPLTNITPLCGEQFSEYIENLLTLKSLWALQMFDATSKLPSGLMYLNFGELGSFDECIDIRATNVTSTQIITGKYCLGYIIPNLSNSSIIKEVLIRETIFNSLGDISQSQRTQNPTWAMCVPNSCSANDVNVIGNYIFGALGLAPALSMGFQDTFCQTAEDVYPAIEPKAIAAITLLTILAVVVIISTLFEIYQKEIKNNEKPLNVLIQGFSLYTNTRKVFKMTKYRPDQFPCLDGLKVLSMIWVVGGHQFSVNLTGPIINSKNILEWVNSAYSMFIVSGTLSVDTFLVVTGFLLSYNFIKSRQKGAKFNVILYYLHRYLRLTPPLAVVVLVSATLLKYMGSGPKWPSTNMAFQGFCEDHWWSALLYIQNYVNVTNMCVGQTWYLSIDMQLYIISPIIFYILWKWPKIAFSIIGVIILAILSASFYIAWIYDMTAILSNIYGDAYNYNNKYYLLTHTRAAPWFIGVILGYYLFQIRQNNIKFRLNKLLVITLWLISISILLACVFGGHSTLRGKDYDKIGNVLHITFVRPSWSIAIAFVILLCTTNNGGPINWLLSRPIYQVFNRFTYSIYLTHVTMLYMKAFAVKAPIYFSEFDMAYQFWGTLWFAIGLSSLLVFMVESPMIVIEKLILGCFVQDGSRSKAPNDVEKGGIDNNAFEK